MLICNSRAPKKKEKKETMLTCNIRIHFLAQDLCPYHRLPSTSRLRFGNLCKIVLLFRLIWIRIPYNCSQFGVLHLWVSSIERREISILGKYVRLSDVFESKTLSHSSERFWSQAICQLPANPQEQWWASLCLLLLSLELAPLISLLAPTSPTPSRAFWKLNSPLFPLLTPLSSPLKPVIKPLCRCQGVTLFLREKKWQSGGEALKQAAALIDSLLC